MLYRTTRNRRCSSAIWASHMRYVAPSELDSTTTGPSSGPVTTCSTAAALTGPRPRPRQGPGRRRCTWSQAHGEGDRKSGPSDHQHVDRPNMVGFRTGPIRVTVGDPARPPRDPKIIPLVSKLSRFKLCGAPTSAARSAGGVSRPADLVRLRLIGGSAALESGRALDIGCGTGTGTDAVYLATHG